MLEIGLNARGEEKDVGWEGDAPEENLHGVSGGLTEGRGCRFGDGTNCMEEMKTTLNSVKAKLPMYFLINSHR